MHLPSLNRYSQLAVSLVIILLFAYILVWLWQRQPKGQREQTIPQPASKEAILQKTEGDLEISPSDAQVLSPGPVKFKGKTLGAAYVAIYTNDFQTLTRADDEGEIEKEVQLTTGLNQVLLTTVSPDLTKYRQKSLNLFVASENLGNTVFAGSVKSIFDTLVTIATSNGDRNVRTSNSTKIDVPQEEQSAGPAIKNIRVGDYAIALGDSQDKDTQIAASLQIIRDNKPQNTEILTQVVIITNVKNNLFSAKKVTGSEISEFSLVKQSKVEKDDSTLKIIDITRDKNAFIFYHPENNQNIVDLVYLLP